jgi:uncharacterized protein (TIGR00369 family)
MTDDRFFTQEGMEHTLRHFCAYQNSIPDSINSSMGIEFISCNYAEKTAEFAFPVTDWMRNPGGVMHGGAISAALDMAMGSCTCYFSGCKLTPTISLQLNFLRPIPVGGRLHVHVRIHNCGRTMGYAMCHGVMEGKEDKSVITGNGVYHVPSGDESVFTEVLSAAMAEIS